MSSVFNIFQVCDEKSSVWDFGVHMHVWALTCHFSVQININTLGRQWPWNQTLHKTEFSVTIIMFCKQKTSLAINNFIHVLAIYCHCLTLLLATLTFSAIKTQSMHMSVIPFTLGVYVIVQSKPKTFFYKLFDCDYKQVRIIFTGFIFCQFSVGVPFCIKVTMLSQSLVLNI